MFDTADEWLKAAETLATGEATPIAVGPVKTTYENGETLDGPDGAAKVAGGPGKGAFAFSKRIEFIHFGVVHRDRAKHFQHAGVDDQANEGLDGFNHARAIQFRAALLREGILLRSQVESLQAGIRECNEGPPPPPGAPAQGGLKLLGSYLGVLGDFVGGSGAAAHMAQAGQLEPQLVKLDAILAAISGPVIGYKPLHEAGRLYHDIRCEVRKFVETHLDRLRGGGETPAGLLSSIPLLPALPPVVGQVVGLMHAIPRKAFDIYLEMLMAMTLVMEPAIDRAAAARSIDAIRKMESPVYQVWYGATQTTFDLNQPDLIPSTGLGPLDTELKKLESQNLQGVKNEITKVEDFLSGPFIRTPGNAYVDRCFAADNVTGGDGLMGFEAMGAMAAKSFETALGLPLPGFVASMIAGVTEVLAGFLRAVYGQLVMRRGRPIDRFGLGQAGRKHIIDALIDKLMDSAGFLQSFRDFDESPTFQGRVIPIRGTTVVNRLKDMISQNLGKYIDPVIKWAMRDLEEILNGGTRPDAMTMEHHLGMIPMAFARTFRNVFFPIWDMIIKEILAPLNNLLAGDMNDGVHTDLSNGIDDVRNVLVPIRDGLERAKNVRDEWGDGLSGGTGDVGQVAKIIQAATQSTTPQAAPPAPTAGNQIPAQQNPGMGMPVTKSDLQAVKPELKWQDPPPDDAPKKGDEGSAKATAPTTGTPALGGGA